MEENNVKITGKIVEEPTYLLTARGGRKIYTSVIEIMRTSGVLDVIPIQVPDLLETKRKLEMNRTKISKPLCKYPDCFRCVYPDCTCNEGLTKKGNDELVRELAKR